MHYTQNKSNCKVEVARAISLLVDRTHDVMLQALPSRVRYCLFGNGPAMLLAAVNNLAKSNPSGIYFTLNPVREGTTRCVRNEDIVARRFFLVDIDRDKTIEPVACATEAEKQQVYQLGKKVIAHVRSLGWSPPIVVDSGNGLHLLWRVEFPNDAVTNELFKRVLAALSTKFGLQIDTCVYDARRIIRLPGTLNAKGSDTPERPYRRARFLEVPDSSALLTQALMQAVIDPNLPEQPKADASPTATIATTAKASSVVRSQRCSASRIARTCRSKRSAIASN